MVVVSEVVDSPAPSPLCSFTARITEIQKVLKDLNQGRYERTMVSQQAKGQSSPTSQLVMPDSYLAISCPSHPMSNCSSSTIAVPMILPCYSMRPWKLKMSFLNVNICNFMFIETGEADRISLVPGSGTIVYLDHIIRWVRCGLNSAHGRIYCAYYMQAWWLPSCICLSGSNTFL